MASKKRKNQYSIEDQKYSKYVLQFQRFAECKTLDELVNLPQYRLVSVTQAFIKHIKKVSSLSYDEKIKELLFFFYVNEIEQPE